MFESNPQLVEVTAQRNSTRQGAYLILAARHLASIARPCPALITTRWTRSFSPQGNRVSAATRNSFLKGTSNRIFFATLFRRAKYAVLSTPAFVVQRGVFASVTRRSDALLVVLRNSVAFGQS